MKGNTDLAALRRDKMQTVQWPTEWAQQSAVINELWDRISELEHRVRHQNREIMELRLPREGSSNVK